MRIRIANGVAMVGLGTLVVLSAIVTKELVSRSDGPSLAMVESDAEFGAGETPVHEHGVPTEPIRDPLAEAAIEEPHARSVLPVGLTDTSIRWFNGRAIRPARTVWMVVTAYSPDERSCGPSADGITSSLHHVQTNGHRLVAADTHILPLGSMISVPGYDQEHIVPVLDRGGKIKGYRLDVLFPTDAEARKWGVKRLPIVVWEYADGNGPEDWRRIRDSK